MEDSHSHGYLAKLANFMRGRTFSVGNPGLHCCSTDHHLWITLKIIHSVYVNPSENINEAYHVSKLLGPTKFKSKCQDPGYFCKQCFQKNITTFWKQCYNFMGWKKWILNLDRLEIKLKRCFLPTPLWVLSKKGNSICKFLAVFKCLFVTWKTFCYLIMDLMRTVVVI